MKEAGQVERKEDPAMRLTIKNPEAHRLAQAISQATGETMTRVVTEALRERYARLERGEGRASISEILAIADGVSADVEGPYLDHGVLLYDENGLPK